jgi:hypothetical protein
MARPLEMFQEKIKKVLSKDYLRKPICAGMNRYHPVRALLFRMYLTPGVDAFTAFKFPSIDALGAWKLWWLVDLCLRYSPFHIISGLDVTTNERYTYYQWNKMMLFIKTEVQNEKRKSLKEFRRPATESKALELFDIGFTRLAARVPKLQVEENGRETQLKFLTGLRHIREAGHANKPDRRRRPFKPRKRKRKTNSVPYLFFV